MPTLTKQLFQDAFKTYGLEPQGDLPALLNNSTIKYYGGRCLVYQIECFDQGRRVVIGGNFASNGKPSLKPGAQIDFK